MDVKKLWNKVGILAITMILAFQMIGSPIISPLLAQAESNQVAKDPKIEKTSQKDVTSSADDQTKNLKDSQSSTINIDKTGNKGDSADKKGSNTDKTTADDSSNNQQTKGTSSGQAADKQQTDDKKTADSSAGDVSKVDTSQQQVTGKGSASSSDEQTPSNSQTSKQQSKTDTPSLTGEKTSKDSQDLKNSAPKTSGQAGQQAGGEGLSFNQSNNNTSQSNSSTCPGVNANGFITDNLITSVSMTKKGASQALTPGDRIDVSAPYNTFKMDLKFEFALPNGHCYGVGDKYKIEVPDELHLPTHINSVALKDSTGTTIGHFITKNNNFIITFNDKIENKDDIAGYVEAEISFNKNYSGPANPDPITFPIKGGDEVTYPVTFHPSAHAIDKSGQPYQQTSDGLRPGAYESDVINGQSMLIKVWIILRMPLSKMTLPMAIIRL